MFALIHTCLIGSGGAIGFIFVPTLSEFTSNIAAGSITAGVLSMRRLSGNEMVFEKLTEKFVAQVCVSFHT